MRYFMPLSTLSLALVFAGLSGLNSPAVAQDAPVCEGRDLLAAMKVERPAVHADIKAATDKEINARGLLWKIEGQGVAPSYLYGTMHFSDQRVTRLRAPLPGLVKKARKVAGELGLLGAEKQAAQFQVSARMMLPQGQELRDFVAEGQMAKLETALGNLKLSYQSVRTMRPWVVATLLSQPLCEQVAALLSKPVVDDVVLELAKANNVPTMGLETIDEQIGAMDSLPRDLQEGFLASGIEMAHLSEDVHATMIAMYLREEVYPIVPLSFALVEDKRAAEQWAVFQDVLIDKRNKTMLARALPEIRKGNFIMAVGALHLQGQDGLVNLLRQAGYTVSRIALQ